MSEQLESFPILCYCADPEYKVGHPLRSATCKFHFPALPWSEVIDMKENSLNLDIISHDGFATLKVIYDIKVYDGKQHVSISAGGGSRTEITLFNESKSFLELAICDLADRIRREAMIRRAEGG